ncbi:hypothetical protein PISMIDRAFT_683575, partial [Pisolithus microcarpus 441]
IKDQHGHLRPPCQQVVGCVRDVTLYAKIQRSKSLIDMPHDELNSTVRCYSAILLEDCHSTAVLAISLSRNVGLTLEWMLCVPISWDSL